MNEQNTTLQQENSAIVEIAQSIAVFDKDTMENAKVFVRQIRDVKDKVTEYWSEPKKSAHTAWKNIVAKEKEMIDKLESAEKTVTKAINVYVSEETRKLQEEQNRLAELRRIESEKMLKEAVKLEESGDIIGAEITLKTAEILDSNSVMQNKFDGTRTVPVVVITNHFDVPAYSEDGSYIFRNIDEKEILKYYKQTGKVPKGIEIRNEVVATIRR